MLLRVRLLLACLATGFASAPAAAEGLFEMSWRELSPGVWLGAREDAMRSPVLANTVFVVGDDSVLVFDGGGVATQGEQTLAQIRNVTGKPVSAIVVSHWHGDHHRGNGPLIDAFPDADIISHSFTRDAITGGPMKRVADGEKDLSATYDAVAKIAGEGKWFDGSELEPEEIEYFNRFMADKDEYLAEFERNRIDPPARVFDDELELDLGGRKVKLMHIAPGNTKGDVMLYLPDVKILATGDVVVAPVPYGFFSYPQSWIGVLNKIASMDVRTLVPGHGAVQTDTDYVRLVSETLSLVVAQVDVLAKDGKELKEVAPAVDFSAVEDRFTHGDPVLARFFAMYFKQPIVSAQYTLATGGDNESLDYEPPAADPQ
jgi:glyoxylase-like metal-dependent hydrolase (beta-lactamase superfamily II)